MRFLSVNLDSFLIELSDLTETMALFRHLQHAKHVAIVDMIPAAKTILVQFNSLMIEQQQLTHWIAQQKIRCDDIVAGREVIIDVQYDGEDLISVAELLGMSTREVIQRHTEAAWQVAFIGFAPGFGYLIRPDQPFGSVPRLASPRKKIPAGSVGLAGEYSGVYPKESPGGWQLIGRTHEQMWDVHREFPAHLMPGNQIIFRDRTSQSVTVNIPKVFKQSSKNIQQGEAVLEILQSGMQTLLQDEGRVQQFSLGVGVGGALDKYAMHLANRCVGNPDNATVLEILNGGFKAKILAPMVIAITGAQGQVHVDYADGTSGFLPCSKAVALDQGDVMQIAQPTHGLRHYVAIRGGIAAEPILGSTSFDTLAELGTTPLKAGDQVHVADLAVQAVADIESIAQTLPQAGDVVELDFVLGPRTDWFKPESLDLLFEQTWLVTNEINRIGLRLKGEYALQRCVEKELPSEGTCVGALQVPPNGQPVLFMNDHPLTGGYPVIGAVANDHLDLVAQIPSGCLIKFKKVSIFMDELL